MSLSIVALLPDFTSVPQTVSRTDILHLILSGCPTRIKQTSAAQTNSAYSVIAFFLLLWHSLAHVHSMILEISSCFLLAESK